MRTIAASRSRSLPKNRSASFLIRTPWAKGPPTAACHRVSYSSSGVPSRRWSAAVRPAIRPAIIATLFPPPFVAMTMPAASPTSIALSFTVRGGGPITGTYEPVEQTLQVPVKVLPRSQADVRAMGLRDDPCVSSRGEVAEEHVRGVAEITVRGRAHRGRGHRPLKADGLRYGGARAV